MKRRELEHIPRAAGSIGELSPFHNTFGYYAHGVGPETAILPRKWQTRLVKLETPDTGGCMGWCLSPLDLAVGKLLAGRDKDFAFVKTMLRDGMIQLSALDGLMQELSASQAEILRGRITRCTNTAH